MKNKFHGYYPLSEEEFDSLWENAFISVDSNVLLNLYSYSEETMGEILDLLRNTEKQLWISHQAAFEYLKNRVNRIDTDAKEYRPVSDALQKLRETLETGRRHPFIGAELQEEFSALADKIGKALNEGEQGHLDFIHNDMILEGVTSLFDGKLGESFSKEELDTVYKEGRDRFRKKVPPGYKDDQKLEPEKFGDLIIWKQLIEKAKELEQPLIFITDDSKEDWWLMRGKSHRVGPRPELLQEFKVETGQNVYIYSSEQFIELTNERGQKISAETIREVEDAAERRQKKHSDLELALMDQRASDALAGRLPSIRQSAIGSFATNSLQNKYDKTPITFEELRSYIARLEAEKQMLGSTNSPIDELFSEYEAILKSTESNSKERLVDKKERNKNDEPDQTDSGNDDPNI